ncbi:nicotinate phosphoribosyltransferase [Anopheles sinensis]|uniref:Nicotinate phosphoribosyltransferase n=1 Tax=Anopheles sinensis TaxID=74873 RepID=A0A084WUT7_ANOSI|nr:nicotinate phosphoribosyltransferase [Anopheles sinensis]
MALAELSLNRNYATIGGRYAIKTVRLKACLGTIKPKPFWILPVGRPGLGCASHSFGTASFQ